MHGTKRNRLQPLLLSLGLLLVGSAAAWAALDEGKAERLPPGWEPAGERLEQALDRLEQPQLEQPSERAGEPAVRPVSGSVADPAIHPVEADIAAAGGGFDLNRATEEQWDALPGIGPAKARAIVEERERNGPFQGIDDLERVKGIGPKLVERLREAIEAGDE